MDLYSRFSKKKYFFSEGFGSVMEEYLGVKKSKDFVSRFKMFLSGELDNDEGIIFISSLITHYLIACKQFEYDPKLDISTLSRALNDCMINGYDEVRVGLNDVVSSNSGLSSKLGLY